MSGITTPAARRSRRAMRTLAATALLVALLASTVPVSASVDPDTKVDTGEPARAVPRQFSRPGGAPKTHVSTHFWASHTLGRGYFLLSPGRNNSEASANHVGFTTITAVDLESGQEVARQALEQPGYASPTGIPESQGADHAMVVDDEGGRLFVATQTASVGLSGTQTPDVVAGYAVRTAGGHLCARPGSEAIWAFGCLSGVSVVDAETLEHQRHIPLKGLMAESQLVSPQLLTMSYSPPAEHRGAKLHLLVEDTAAAGELADGKGYQASTRAHSVAATILVQLDVDSGTQDWALRLDDCRGAMASNRNAPYRELAAYRHQAAVLRSPDPADRALYVGCHMVSQTLQGVVLRVPLTEQETPAAVPVALVGDDHPGRTVAVPGPDRVHQILADPHSGRLAMQVLDGSPLAEVWWIFDLSLMRFVGTVGIGGPIKRGGSWAAIDQGRLYVLAGRSHKDGRTFAGGLFVADVDRTPVAQALVYPRLAELFPSGFDSATSGTEARWALTVQRMPDGARRLWLPNHFSLSGVTGYRAAEDRRLGVEAVPVDDYAGRTLDLDEADGVTDASLDGAARGYGVRALLVGGAEAAARAGPVDPIGSVEQCNDPDWGEANGVTQTVGGAVRPGASGGPCHGLDTPVTSPCLHGNREIVLAAVGPQGPAVVDDTGARGTANPITIDSLTGADAEAPVSRCAGQDWDQLWTTALFGRPPVPEPHLDNDLSTLLAECVSGEETTTASTGDPVTGGWSAAVSCEQDAASGHAYARGTSLDGLTVAEALSNFRIYRDPARGIVSRVESVARGVALDGVLRIDTVRGVAESWANGRRQPIPAADRDPGYDPNCDVERSAGTCFRRHLFGVWTPEWSCGPCGDEHALLEGMNAVLGRLGTLVQLREPDPRLRVGAENGYLAAIQKSEADRFGDLVLNNDLLQTVLPTLEIVRNAAPSRLLSNGGGRGRQIYQFAGVEVSSSYGISCLLVHDAETGTCAPPSEPPGALRLELRDLTGAPLAGGAFEVRVDGDGDGLLGLADTLLPQGACLTAVDGVGTCAFEGLRPGGYLVSQVGAPEGFARLTEAHAVELGSGEQRTVTFTNAPDASTIEVRATTETGAPLAGAAFSAYPDPDGDGKVAPDAAPAASCVTGDDGTCRMRVPTGHWVLAQTGVPAGLAGVEPIAFAFASGGQTATVTVVNAPTATQPAAPSPAPAPVYSPPVDVRPPVHAVTDAPPADQFAEPPAVSLPEAVGGTVVRVVRAPGDALRLLVRSPVQALAWTAAVALFGLAAMAVRRRSLALRLQDGEVARKT